MNTSITNYTRGLILTCVVLLFVFMSVSCDITEQDNYQELVVVEAYLTANRPLPEIKISRTSPAGQIYDQDELYLSGAEVRIVLLDSAGNDLEIFFYTLDIDKNSYLPNVLHLVQPQERYRLDIQFKDREEVIKAYTTVPDQFEIVSEIPQSVVYQSNEQLELSISAPGQLGSQNVFVFSTKALEPTEENLTPFYKASVENEDIELTDLLINSSGLINEGNFEINSDGTITLQFPWIGVAFYGENEIIVNSVDRNLDELIRSQQVQLGGSTLSPGEIPNLTYNIEGGIGIFGSLASDTTRTNFIRQ